MGIAGDIALILIFCLLCGLVAQRLGFPLLLGYIVAGIMVSPGTPGPSVGDVHEIELLADIGVALLLFTVGLEFPAEKLRPVRHIALLGAPLQMLLVGGFGVLLGQAVGWDIQQSIWFGALISISSTMVVLKILMSRGLMETLSSKVMLGILVVQDLAVIPMMILLPALGNLEEGISILGLALVRAFIFVAVMGIVGTRLLPWLLTKVVKAESRELFIIVVIGIGLGIGYGTYLVGLSFAFGAFLAGLVLSRSEYSHEALADMIPLREVFSLLFFASVGMMLSPLFLWQHILEVVFLVVAVLVGKGVLMAVVTRAFGYKRIIPLAVALSMSQVGEFAFVLARVGKDSGGLNDEVYYVVVSVAVVTMALTPFSSGPAYNVYQWWRRNQPQEPIPLDTPMTVEGRLVVIGYHKLGRFISGLLSQIGHQPFVIDSDPGLVQQAKEAGLDAMLAEEAAPDVMEKLELAKATLVLITVSDRLISRSIAETLHNKGGAAVIGVAASMDHFNELEKLGVQDIVLAPLETGLEMVHQALLRLDYDEVEAHTIVDGVRQNHYQLRSRQAVSEVLSSLNMEWFELQKDLTGPVKRQEVREQTGASVVAVMREGQLHTQLGPDFVPRKGDRVAAVGTHEQRAKFRLWCSEGLKPSPK